jgi:5-methyltetrahydrofolate--homocysteine methyltransferase
MSKNGLLERLKSGEILISDGATGTYLQARGLEPGGCPEEWNASHPEVVRGMAADYFAAGSDAVETNSFGGSPFMLKKYGYADRVEELNRLAARHARSVAPPGRYVIGSVGPTGEFLEPVGPVSVEEMYEGFVRQVTALAEGGADAICAETMTALEEACLVVRATKERTDLVAMATMTFDRGPRGNFTMMGVTPEDAVRGLLDAGADVVGANCGNGILYMIEISAEMRKVTDAPILVHANAGIPAVRKGQIIYPETPDWMGPHYRALVDAGATFVGGCCGTTPDHIRAIVKALRG